MGFDSHADEDGLAILKLRKWDPTEFTYDPSSFKEGFISPTRRFLLLLSYNLEALLLPLVKERCTKSLDPKGTSDRTCSDVPEYGCAGASDSAENISHPCESMELSYDIDSRSEASSSVSGGAFISDVHSLAWGLCGQTHDQHEEDSLRELLFLSGAHGVTVHVLSLDNSGEVVKPAQECNSGEGMWVEWGPPKDFVPDLEVQEISKEQPSNFHAEGVEDDDVSLVSTTKRWWRTFLSSAETLTSGNDVYTKFPSVPSLTNKNALSFRLFDQDSKLLDLLSCGGSMPLDTKNGSRSDLDPMINGSDRHPSSTTFTLDEESVSYSTVGDLRSAYKCVKVFSCSSHCLVGFALSMISSVPDDNSYANGGNYKKNMVVVGQLVSWGIHWLYLAKLHENPGNVPLLDWTDFSFSDRFLVSLSSCGLISLYGAMTGVYVASLDIANISSTHYCLSSQEQENDREVHRNSDHRTGSLSAKRRFKRLLVFPNSSLLGAMDECGVTYVTVDTDHFSVDQCLSQQILPSHFDLDLGLLTGWDVGASEIGYQRVFHKTSVPLDISLSSTQGRSDSVDNSQNKGHMKIQKINSKYWRGLDGPHITSTSGTAWIMSQKKFLGSDLQQSCLMRKVFLPSAGYNENDVMCCSPLGITRLLKRYSHEKKGCQVVHAGLRINHVVNDETDDNMTNWEVSTNEAVGCNFHGFLYLVTEDGLSLVIPSIAIPSNFYPVETIGYRLPNCTGSTKYKAHDPLGTSEIKRPWSPWKLEVLDRVLVYEGPEVAEKLCFENGWDLQIPRIRRLQLALNYLKFDEVEDSLEMLMGVNLAVEGILRLLLAALYLMISKVINDSEVSAASRLLALATAFATRFIRKYGLLQHNREASRPLDVRDSESSLLELTNKHHNEDGISRSLREMAQFLVVTRKIQGFLNAKFKRPGASMENVGLTNLARSEISEDESKILVVSSEAPPLVTSNQRQRPNSASKSDYIDAENRALVPADATGAEYVSNFQSLETAVLISEGSTFETRASPLENPKDMMARWDLDNLDLKTVVRDALLSGRLPLAVLRLHLHRVSHSSPGTDNHDTFNDIRVAGKAIAYDLLLKGDVELAITTLQKLGEDVEITLKQIVFGTVRRSLRVKVAEEMKRHAYLGPHELKRLEILSLIERVYPCNNFFSTLSTKRRERNGAFNEDAPEERNMQLLHPDNLTIACGEVDGVVLGAWTSIDGQTVLSEVDDDSSHAAYWTAAVAWSDAWDQRDIDRVLLDQPLLMGVNVLWESQLEYHVCHNDWVEASKMLEVIPSYALSNGSLIISLDDVHPTSAYGQDIHSFNNYGNFLEEVDTVCMDVPSIRAFRFAANRTCSSWLRMLMEQQLAKNFIFLTEYWHGTADIVPLLAQSGFITDMHPLLDGGIGDSSDAILDIGNMTTDPDAVQGLHKVVVRFCAQYNLLNLLDLYLDLHNLALDQSSLLLLQDAVGDNEWAKCLLLLRVKGREYDASFSNVRAVALGSLVPGNKLNILESDNIIQAVDDIAEGAGEMAALATLMFAPIPLQECLNSGSVNRHCSSAQCTLENLRPALQRFPTLWNTLVAACFGQDLMCCNLAVKKKVPGYSDLLDSLHWREGVFFSSVRDTTILQMIPCWFPKPVRRLIQLYVQGPIGWHSMANSETGELSMLQDIYYVVSSSGHSQISATSWEAAVQKHIEEELYASSLKEAGAGLEHHLHRGRALSALNHILSARVHKLKSENKLRGQSETLSSGQANIQSDVQMLLAPITESEESVLSSVVPLAIEHFSDTVMVASCAFLLELCGLSTSILRINIAALRRISSFYQSVDNKYHKQMSPKVSALYPSAVEVDVTESLARALADGYLHEYSSNMMQKGDKATSGALLLVLQHLERASLPLPSNEMTCGSWLSTGNGDGADLRSHQKASSEQWQLVTTFCQMHNISLSTKYLTALARDNDWVGFLSEAQLGKYPFETVIQVASQEFKDPRLKIHIVTVLKSMQSRRQLSSSSNLDTADKRAENLLPEENGYIPAELFGIIAECENHEKPGEALLLKAKNLGWSILAMIASCFPDTSPFSCLSVWLEITAARETSAIKVNDIASQIAKNVRSAVESTNSLPASDRSVSFHYNRKSSKRRRLTESVPVDSFALESFQISEGSGVSNTRGVKYEGENKRIGVGDTNISVGSDSMDVSLSRMVSVLCEQRLFLPLLQAFEIFLPSCSLLPFIRALQAFSQMRLSEASAHLGSFSSRIKEESSLIHHHTEREGKIETSWIVSTAVKAADAVLLTCPSPYEKRCLLRLLATTDFGDEGCTATRFGRLCWKIDMAEHSLRSDDCPLLGNESFDDASLLTALEKNGYWEQARSWAKQLEASGESQWKSAANHVTEMQAEAMVTEWKEFLWDVPEERISLWTHCQTLFIRHSFPALQAGLFFLKHAEIAEKDIPAREIHEILLIALQWLSGMITLSNPFYPLHLLREIETRVWLLAVESETQLKSENESSFTNPTREPGAGKDSSLIDRTATVIVKMDNHINARRRNLEKNDKESSQGHLRNLQTFDSGPSSTTVASTKPKRRTKGMSSRRTLFDEVDKKFEYESTVPSVKDDSPLSDENLRIDASLSKWEERVGPAELERAVLSLLDFGQTAAARQLQTKLSPDNIPSEFLLVDAALKLATLSTPSNKVSVSMLDEEVHSVIQSYNLLADDLIVDPLEVLERLASILIVGSGRGLCRKIVSVVKAANVLGLTFSEAFEKQPIELLQLLSLKAQESFEEANLLVQTHSMPASNIAQILAESFLKGLLAAHRGGYMDSQKEEGPAPLLWRFSDFLKWAELCPSDSEIGHALMRLVITGQEIPHACEVELLILSHHFYKLSTCLDGVDVLVALAATRVEAYVLEGDFSCLARLITGVGNFYALNFILSILIENGRLDLLVQKYSTASQVNRGSMRGFRMAVLTSLKQFNPNDLDGFAMVYEHFDMRYEGAALMELRAKQSYRQWFLRYDKDQNEELLEAMRYYIEAAKSYSILDAGINVYKACAQASLVSLQIRMPDTRWLDLTETNARRILVEQFRFQEALIVAEAYDLNRPSEWALVLWEQMLNPELTEQFVREFVSVLPLQPSMLIELARFYRSEMQARGDQSQFSVWLTGGGLPADWAKYLGKSFRCLLKRTRDLRLKLQLATSATGFPDVIDACNSELDKVPENAGPLILRKGHGGGYLPLM